MATNLDKLPVCVKLFRQLTEFNWKNTSYFEADLTGDSKTWSLLQDLDSVDCIESISINGEQKEFSLIKESDVIDSVLNISVYYPHNLFSQSLDDLLKKDIKNYHTIPENFYIAECDYFHSEGSEPPEEISDYFCAIEFIKLLKGQADFETNTGELKLFFLTQKKLEISVKYRTNNIKGFGSLKCFSLLKSTISDGLYVGEKNHILKLNLIKGSVKRHYPLFYYFEVEKVLFYHFFLSPSKSYSILSI